MSEEITTVDITSQHIVINQDRSVAVPSLIKKSIVQRDHNIERLTFDCPRYWYGKDISTLNIYVNYISVSQKAKGDDPGSSLCENAVIDESDQDMMHFDWVITNNISQDVGGLLFLVCAKSVDSDGNEDVHWNSHLCKDLEVQEGLEASDSIAKKYPDVIEQIFQRLDNVDGVSPEQIAAAVEEYLVENPPSGMTADEKAQLNKNTEDISQLSEENDALKTEIEALMVNAKSYGIKGDGETDDSILLNDLVTKLNTEGGGVIYLPDGKYRLNTRITWKSNVSLVGESHNAVLMPYCDNSVSQGFAAISWLNTDSTKQNGYDASNPFINCHFKNFTIDGINQNPANYDSYPKGINMHFLKDCTFENIQFLNTFATGLGIDFLENVFIHNIYCFNCGRGYEMKTEETISGGAGIGIGTMGMSKESCIISDCITDGCGNYGIFLEGGSIFPENGCKSHYTIANCQCINGRNYGIAVKGTDNVVIANNIMRNNARDGFALLPRPDRCCKGIEVSNNLSKSNGGCGFRFADGDYTDIISSELYVVGNVSEKNTKDGILISSVITKAFFNNNSIIENARGIAIADNDYFDVYFSGNMILNCTQNAVVKGLFKNTNLLANQLVKLIPVHDMDYINGYVDDSGTEIEHSSSKTTKSFTYCKGSQYCGFYFDLEYTQIGSENRICYCHWYDGDMNFISRYGEKANSRGWKRFTPPEGACYVKYRIGINTGELQNSQLKGIYLMRYMTDRCETN